MTNLHEHTKTPILIPKSRRHVPALNPDSVLISIITVVYNAAADIRATIDSVLPHLDDDVEYIIIDGGSNDGTIDIIREYGSRIAAWLSEADNGIYDAMNKGSTLARGRFIYHLNIGDRLLVLPKDELEKQSYDVACVAFAVELSSGKVFRPFANIGLNFHNTLHHQGCFYNRERVGPYNPKFNVFADFDINQRIRNAKEKIVIYELSVAYHDEGGISNTTNHFKEVYDIVRLNNGVFWLIVSYTYFKIQGALRRVGLK